MEMHDWPDRATFTVTLSLSPGAPQQSGNTTLAEWVRDRLRDDFEDHDVEVTEVPDPEPPSYPTPADLSRQLEVTGWQGMQATNGLYVRYTPSAGTPHIHWSIVVPLDDRASDYAELLSEAVTKVSEEFWFRRGWDERQANARQQDRPNEEGDTDAPA